MEQAILNIDRLAVDRIFAEARRSIPPLKIIDGMVVPVLENIGNKWYVGEVALSQVYMAGRILERIVDNLFGTETSLKANQQQRVAIGVFRDYHVLGKKSVISFLRAGGHQITDLGNGLGADEIVHHVKTYGIKILFLSVLMLHSALAIKSVKTALMRESPETLLVVGGAPFRFDDHLWQEVGADAMGRSAGDALTIADRLIRSTPWE
ncbi:MAG: cobalamin-dependent protein [Magnetococcales bacterium]|nr:cobalamin-dependent protein [Magnetococcales bacterium]